MKKSTTCVYIENRDQNKKNNTNKFVKQHRSRNLQHKVNYEPESIYANIEYASIYKIFTPSTRCRCFYDQDNHQYTLPEALMCIANIPVLLTDGFYLTTG